MTLESPNSATSDRKRLVHVTAARSDVARADD
jgi:hypothetical protein